LCTEECPEVEAVADEHDETTHERVVDGRGEDVGPVVEAVGDGVLDVDAGGADASSPREEVAR